MKTITPKKISIYLAIFAIILSFPLFIFFSNTFTRNWKVNQKYIFTEQLQINDILAIPQIKLGETTILSYTPILKTSDVGLGPIDLGTISIRFYSVCILLGVIAGYIMALYLASLNYVSGTVIDRLLIGLVVFGLVGARLFFVIFSFEVFKDKPLAIVTEIGQGGMAIFGTFIACFVYIWLYCKRYRFNIYEFLDFMAPSVLIGQVLGRFGNFFNYEGYGPETSVWWKMYIPESANSYGIAGSKYFHPTFLYEVIPNFFVLLFLLWNYKNMTNKNSGLVFASYCICYGIIRFCTEFFRLDSLKLYLPDFLKFAIYGDFKIEFLMVSQLVAFALFAIGIWVFKKRSRVIYLKKDMTELFV
jgi:phosphatidylglycerol---prolipoprotein diacylglyceryl transferase